MCLFVKTNVAILLITTPVFYFCLCKCFINNCFLLRNMLFHVACCRASAFCSSDDIAIFDICCSELLAEMWPCTYVFILLLYADELFCFAIFLTESFQLFYL